MFAEPVRRPRPIERDVKKPLRHFVGGQWQLAYRDHFAAAVAGDSRLFSAALINAATALEE